MKFYRGSAESAVGYAFSDERRTVAQRADDYYLDDEAEHVDRLVVSAGGGIERDVLDRGQYQAWVEGCDPLSGELRGKPRCEPERALRFVEVTVNGPKTWTIAAEIHPDIAQTYEAAQDRAVESLARLFARRCTTRVGAGGAHQQGLAQVEVAAIRHYTSRAGDPHRHVHLQLNARVLSVDGRWRSVDSTAFRLMIGEINGLGHLLVGADPQFRTALAAHGYTLGKGGEIAELAVAVPVLSKRHAQIERNIAGFEQRWRTEHPGEEPSRDLRRTWDHDAWLRGRPGKGPGIGPDHLSARWFGELAEAGIDEFAERARPGHVLTVGTPAGRVDREQVGVAALGRLGAARSRWNEHDLVGAVCIELSELGVVADQAAVGELVEDSSSRALDRCLSVVEGETRVASHIRHLTSPEVVECWSEVQDRLAARSQPGAEASVALVAAAVAQLEEEGQEHDHGPVVLDDGQVRAVQAVAGSGRLVNVEGAAGTGKTTMLAVATRAIEARGGRVVLVAPSAKAAKVAERETGAPGDTLAKLIYEHGYRWDDVGRMERLAPGEIDPTTGVTYLGPRPSWRLGETVTVIVDEAGMVDQDTGRALLVVADETGARVVHVGDRAQLPAVGRGGNFEAAAAWSPPIEMAEIHRFRCRDEAGRWVRDDVYAELSHRIRTGIEPASDFDALVERGQVQIHSEPGKAWDAIASTWLAAHAVGEDSVIVAATNVEATAIAGRIRDQLVVAGHVDDERTVMGRDGNPIGAGDRITTRRNDADLEVLNREEWTVHSVNRDGGLTVRGGLQDRTTSLDPEYVADSVHLAYAVTDYGGQGTTTHHGVVSLGEQTTAAGLYVGMTRGRQTNTVHVTALDLDDARRQWVDAARRDRVDRGLEVELVAARQEVSASPLPPVQPELVLDVDDLLNVAEMLNKVDHHDTSITGLERQATTARSRLETTRHRLDALDAAGSRSTYRSALAAARGIGDDRQVESLTRYRSMTRPQRVRARSDLRAEAIAAQRTLTGAIERQAPHRLELAATRQHLTGVEVPEWLQDPMQRHPLAIERRVKGVEVLPS